jgi:hypothetical protein
VPADATRLTELKRVSSVDSVVVVGLLLHRVEQLTPLIGGAHSVNKVVKLSYYSKLSKLLELVTRSCSSKLLLLLTYSVNVFHYRAAQPIEPPKTSWHDQLLLRIFNSIIIKQGSYVRRACI